MRSQSSSPDWVVDVQDWVVDVSDGHLGLQSPDWVVDVQDWVVDVSDGHLGLQPPDWVVVADEQEVCFAATEAAGATTANIAPTIRATKKIFLIVTGLSWSDVGCRGCS